MQSETPDRTTSELVALKLRVKELEACLGLNDRNLGSFFKLSASMTNLLGLMLSVPNVTPEMIQTRLRIASESKVAIRRLRVGLDKWAAENEQQPFIIHAKRQMGYWFDEETKKRIRAVTQGVTGVAQAA
jgi:hypothetical protein